MLVKKIDVDWKPDKQKDIKVGEIIDITDPKRLILEGKVVAVTKEGVEISAYELYGVITRDERKDFEEYLKVKKQKDLGQQLQKESEELKEKAKIQEVVKPVEKVEEVKEVKKTAPKSQKLAEL
jgi:hypothetical protein